MGDTRRLRASLAAAAVLLALPALAGCIAPVQTYYAFDADAQYKNPGVFPGNYTFSSPGSLVLSPGTLAAGKPEVVQLRSDLPAYGEAGKQLSDAEVTISLAYWRPENVTGPVPVIVDAGPYYEVDQHCPTPKVRPADCRVPLVNDTIDYPSQTTPFLLKNYLPKGYAVAQVAVRGTGTSGGCMDLLGPSEQHDLGLAIDWLATQPWANGNVGMIGASYDGSTPWEVAATGNPHLKTIVPVSGLPDIYDLMFHNGSAETRGAAMHNQVYWGYGFSDGFPYSDSPTPLPPVPQSPVPLPVATPDAWPNPWPVEGEANGRTRDQDLQNLICPEVVEASAIAQLSADLGGRWNEASGYWERRDHKPGVLQNYKGSVFLIHGLQDWNVDPHAAIPFNAELRAAGIETKEWYGQWDHAFPDQSCSPRVPGWVTAPCRLDFAEVLGRWFDHYLKGNTTQPLGPAIQVQDNVGFWRNADSYPPANANWTALHLDTAQHTLSTTAVGAETTVRLDPPANGKPANVVQLLSAPLEADLHLSGMPTLRVPFAPQTSGGMLAAWLLDQDEDGNVRAPYAGVDLRNRWSPFGIPVIGHAQLNLLYYDGGETRQTLQPGERHTARIQFEPLEVLVPEGHRLVLWLFQYEYPDHQASTTSSAIDVFLGPDSDLQLPTLNVDPTTVFPVPGVVYPDRTQLPHMYVDKPVLPGVEPSPQVAVAPPQAVSAPTPTPGVAAPLTLGRGA